MLEARGVLAKVASARYFRHDPLKNAIKLLLPCILDHFGFSALPCRPSLGACPHTLNSLR